MVGHIRNRSCLHFASHKSYQQEILKLIGPLGSTVSGHNLKVHDPCNLEVGQGLGSFVGVAQNIVL